MNINDLLAHADLVRIAVAALIAGFVMAAASRNFVGKLHGALYLGFTAVIINTHNWNLIYLAMAYGVVSSIMLLSVTRRRRTQNA